MSPFKVAFTGLGLIYGGMFTWGVAAHLPNIPTVGILGMLWCATGWYVTDKCLN